MFEIGWSELLVIGVVLIVVVGPKDLPRMLRTFGKTTTQLKRMAGDFRKQFDEALREAELDEVRDNIKSMNPTADIRKAMNPIRAVGDEIRSSLMTATKAPEPKVPSADAPARPAEPSVIGNADMQPLASPASPSTNPLPSSASFQPTASPLQEVVASQQPVAELPKSVPGPLAADLANPEAPDSLAVPPADITLPAVPLDHAAARPNGGAPLNGKDASGDSH